MLAIAWRVYAAVSDAPSHLISLYRGRRPRADASRGASPFPLRVASECWSARLRSRRVHADYVDARYDPNFAITSEELAAIAAHVRELRSRVERGCRERIEAMAVEAPN
jgi:hypothetical protein